MRKKPLKRIIGVVSAQVFIVGGLLLTGCAGPKVLEGRAYIPAASLEPPATTSVQEPVDYDLSQTNIQPLETIEPVKPVVFDASEKGAGTETGATTYKVQKGDSFWSISRRFGISMSELASYNGMKLTKPLKYGKTLKIPKGGKSNISSTASGSKTVGGSEYTVKKGDSLWSISRKYGVKVNDLAAANSININSPLKVGQKLKVKGGKSISASSGNSGSRGGAGLVGSEYTVRKGDNLWGISRRFGVKVGDITAANGINSRTPLKVGQKLTIKGIKGKKIASVSNRANSTSANKDEALVNSLLNSPGSYNKNNDINLDLNGSSQGLGDANPSNYLPHNVKDGDTWETVSEMYGIDIKALKSANSNISSAPLKVGETVKIPED